MADVQPNGINSAPGGSISVSYQLTYDGSTVKAYSGTLGNLVSSGTDTSVVLQSLVRLMDPANGGHGGCIYFNRQTGSSGYPFSTAVRTPLATTAGIEITCERGTILAPQANAALPLFVPDRSEVTIGTAGFNDDATIFVNSLTLPNGQTFPASGSANVNTSLVAYTGTASDAGGGGPRLTGCTLTYGPAHTATDTTMSVTVPYETWQNLWIHGFAIDGTAVAAATLGAAIIAGTKWNGAFTKFSQRLNIRGIYVYDNIVTNFPYSGVDLAMVWLRSQQYATNEATQTVLHDIHIHHNRTLTGDTGPRRVAEIDGAASGDAAPPTTCANITYGRIFIHHNKNKMGTQGSGAPAIAQIQVGDAAYGVDICHVHDNSLYNSGDDLIEISNGLHTIIENNYLEDALQEGIMCSWFGDMPVVGSSKTVVRNNFQVQRTQFANMMRTVAVSGANVGTIERSGNVIDYSPLTLTSTATSLAAFRDGVTGTTGTAGPTRWNRIISRDNEVRLGTGITLDVGGQFAAFRYVGDPGFSTPEVAGRGDRVTGTMNFAATSTGAAFYASLQLAGNVRLDDYEVITNVTLAGTITAGSGSGLRLGAETGGSVTQSNLSGKLRHQVVNLSGDASCRAIRVGSTTTLAIPTVFQIEFDHSGLATGSDVSYVATSNQGNIAILATSRWKTTPAPASFTGLTTATGKALSTGYPAFVQFLQGSGSAITAIDISTDGGTTYTNLLTQASGAMPAGPDLWVGPFRSDALVKVTFTTTQPTIKLVAAPL